MDKRIYNIIYNKLYRRLKVSAISKITSVFFTLTYQFLRFGYYSFLSLKIKDKSSIDQVYLEKKLPQKPEQTFNSNFQSIEPSRELSIIVPVYNVEKYVDECIQSILPLCEQVDAELILVNDGSTDSTLKILQKYQSFPFVILLNKDNGGQSSARNLGISVSRGKYITFIDSDDCIVSNVYISMIAYQKKYCLDMVCCNYQTFDGFNYDEGILNSTKQDLVEVIGTPWGKIFKRQIFENIVFPFGYIFEDTIIHGTVFTRIESFDFIAKTGYYYRQHSTSTMANTRIDLRCLDTFLIVKQIISINSSLAIPPTSYFYRFLLMQFAEALHGRVQHLGDDYLYTLLQEAKNILLQFRAVRPTSLTQKEKLIERSIFASDLLTYKQIFRFY